MHYLPSTPLMYCFFSFRGGVRSIIGEGFVLHQMYSDFSSYSAWISAIASFERGVMLHLKGSGWLGRPSSGFENTQPIIQNSRDNLFPEKLNFRNFWPPMLVQSRRYIKACKNRSGAQPIGCTSNITSRTYPRVDP